jgi:hypothetical protein
LFGQGLPHPRDGRHQRVNRVLQERRAAQRFDAH